MDKESDHSLGDLRVGISPVVNTPIFEGGLQPDLRLTAFNELVLGFAFRGHLIQLPPEADDVFVALGPILKKAQVLKELFLAFGDGHFQGDNRWGYCGVSAQHFHSFFHSFSETINIFLVVKASK